MTRPRIADAARVLAEGQSLLVTTHIRPDGDAIGSALALSHGLRGLGKMATIVLEHAVPRPYRFLPGWRDIVPSLPVSEAGRFDVAVVLDCDGLQRAGEVTGLVRAVGRIVEIDHHPGAHGDGCVIAVYPEAAATAELVFELCEALGAPLTVELATCLLTGLTDDTGGFRHSNTTARAHELASRLVAAGADPARIAENLFGNQPPARLVLRGRALARARLLLDGRVILSYLTNEDFAVTGADRADSSYVIDDLRLAADIQVAAVLVETENGQCRVSLRSSSDLDVAAVARSLGGGGHVKAAGCELPGTVAQAEPPLVAALAGALGADGRHGG
ncbi:MAG TPA: bifunctional oligoribonuclease/PAP phosphatase NrnA [Armatimonadota bacterium]|nr:bifunctional oligoribonuclease/PAP phosphatase NrnA [Armatimonadota bacterium]